jgi:predicted RNA-binding Zn ribbon-like protein
MIPASHAFRIHNFGQAAPWVDLANSQMWNGYGRLTDFLDDPRWIADFLQFWRFRVPLPRPPVLREVRKLRQLLRHIAEKTSEGAPIQPREIKALNSWLKVPVFRRLVENQNGLQLAHEPVQNGWPAVLALIADSLAEMLGRQMHDRLKICANSGCAWIFVDRTKARVKRWCSDATCGNRDRVRRSRASHKN